MAKESKESQLTAQFSVDGVNLTIEKTVPDYNIEDATQALVNLVKLLEKGPAIAVTE